MRDIRQHSDALIKLQYTLMTFLFMKTESVAYLAPLLDQILDCLRIGFTGIILFLFIIKRKKLNSLFLCTLFYCGMFFLSTVVNESDVFMCIVTMCDLFGFLMWLDILMGKGPLFCFDVLLLPYEIMIFANLLTILLYPEGMYVVIHYNWHSNFAWLLGYDNSHLPFFLSAITLSVLRSYFLNNSPKLTARSFFLILVCVISLAICRQGTAMVSVFVLLLFIIFPKFFINVKMLNIVAYIFVVAAVFFLIVIFRKQELFAPIIIGILHKDLTFSGRLRIWDRSLKSIAEKPWIGYGKETMQQTVARLGHNHAHNGYLQALYEGGVIRFSAFIGIFFLAAGRLIKEKNNFMSDFLSVAVFAALVAFMGDGFGLRGLFLIFYLAYRIGDIAAAQREYLAVKNRKCIKRIRLVWGTKS